MTLAVITGASRGVGRALAISFARKGYDIACLGRDIEGLEKTALRVSQAGRTAWVYPVDFLDPQNAIKVAGELRASHDTITVLAILASPTPDPDAEADLTGTSTDQIIAYSNVILSSSAILTRELAPLLEAGAPGTILFVTSDWALRGAHGPAAFAGAKAGLTHFARSIRREFGRKAIQVSLLLPGDIASYDADWAEPKWDIDDPVEDVLAELGSDRIPLADICEVAGMIIDRRYSRIEEVIIAPRSGEYDY
jgi:3-oxoacyl-[acyl-carrier protein] reductase